MAHTFLSPAAEALHHLQQLLKINTTNPPGHERAAIDYIAEQLRQSGIEPIILESAPTRANLIARIKGSGKKRALLLTSHIDVVPVEEAHWKYPPFSGEIFEGCVWGRGAVDMKQMTAMQLTLFLEVQRKKIPLERDLVLVVVADEEAGCEYGSKWLVENHPHLLEAEYALNEVGGFSLHLDQVSDKVFYPVGVGERGLCWVKLTAEGDPGHGSMPHDRQALVALARVVDRLGKFPFHSHPLVNRFIQTLANAYRGPRSWVLKFLLSPFLNKFILKNIIPQERVHQFRPLFSNTAAPTIFNAGSKVNVIPSRAELMVDGRILPGQSVETFKKELSAVIGPDIHMEVLVEHNPPPVQNEGEFYQLIDRIVKKHDAKGVCVPYLIPGFTDAAYFSKLGIKCFGFAPVQLPADMKFSEMFHGHNERIPVEGFLWGYNVLSELVLTWCA